MKRNRFKVAQIFLQRVEGPEGANFNLFAFKGGKAFEEANAVLTKMAKTAPDGRFYDKVQYIVQFEDGQIFKGFYRLNKKDEKGADLIKAIYDHWEIFAGKKCPDFLYKKEYPKFLEIMEIICPGIVANYKSFLQKYSLQTDPTIQLSLW